MSDDGRILRLLDLEEIRALKARYCIACDGDIVTGPSHDSDVIAGLYVEDATWALAPLATPDGEIPAVVLEGREAIREFFDSARARIPFSMHFTMSPLIEIHGDRATAHWHVLATMTLRSGAHWIGGHYLDVLVRTAEGWRFASTETVLGFNTPYGEGWGATKYARPSRRSG